MNSLKDLFIFLYNFIPDNPICIETGTQSNFDPNNKDYFSTINLLRYIVKPKNGILYTFDVSEECINKCIEEIERLKIEGEDYKNYVKFIVGDSTETLKYLPNIKPINVVLLDSKEYDEVHMLNEFKLIENYLYSKHIIMCDDIHNVGSVKYKKAVPYIKTKEDLWFEYNTPTGLFVGIKNG